MTCLLILVLTFAYTARSLPYKNDVKNSPTRLSNTNSVSYKNSSAKQQRLRRQVEYDNEYDQILRVTCEEGEGFYAVQSTHDNAREDRRWNWECRTVHSSPQYCHWHQAVNEFDGPMIFMCNENEYLAGVESIHDNYHEDRRWSFYCCTSSGYTTKSCSITSRFQNGLDGNMDFSARPDYFLTGAFSYHDNLSE